MKNKAEKEKFNKQLAELGIKDEDELFCMLLDNELCIKLDDESKENGYTSDWALMEEYGNWCDPQILMISKYKEKYIFWYIDCDNGQGFDLQIDDFAIFDTLDQARKFRDEYPEGEKPLREQFEECVEVVGENIYIEPVSEIYDTFHLNISYKGGLLIEYLKSLDDIDYIKEIISKYHDLEKTLKKIKAEIFDISKKRSFGRANTRYYIYKVYICGESKTYEVPIPSKYQHKRRSTLDFFPYDKILSDFEKQIVYQD